MKREDVCEQDNLLKERRFFITKLCPLVNKDPVNVILIRLMVSLF